jgi:Zn-dependent protease with chaperone function
MSDAAPESIPPPSSEVQEAPESEYYPPTPTGDVPAVAPTRNYKLKVVLVLGALFAFLAFYLGLLAATGYLVYASIFEIEWLAGKAFLLNLGLVAGASMLFLFLLKGLFHRKKFDRDHLVEVTEAEQPRLFAFLRRLASDAGTKLPGRVYLSHDVNAAVMYPQSLLTLVWPVRKNLVIGLGLVNAIDVAELKAILGHELGHFSQASMRLGSYVYVTSGVIADLVDGRDKWDRALRTWQSADLRISFPAWIIAAIVWAIRKILALGWKGLALAKLSLARQMEFNADANAVRLAGSDAIVSGLWKSERAQLALGHAMNGVRSVSEHGKFTRDLFYHQARSLKRLDTLISDDPDTRAHFASILAKYEPGPALHFKAGGEQVSTLWQTHPKHHEREAAAKALYVPSPPDPRPAWSLFRDPKRVRRRVTEEAYRAMGASPKALLPASEVEALIEEERGEMRQAPHYHDLYEDRVIAPGDMDAVVKSIEARAEAGTLDLAGLRSEASAFTGPDLAAKTGALAKLRGEARAIALLKGGATLTKKTIEFRGKQRDKDEIVALEDKVDAELAKLHEELHRADACLFRYHYAVARSDEAKKAELLTRYRFLVDVQELLASVAQFEPAFEHVVGQIQARAEFSSSDVTAMRQLFTNAREALKAALAKARRLKRPRLAHLGDERPLDDFLLPEPLLEPLVGTEIAGAWLNRLFEQHGGIAARLRKLHFKNLGALLAFQEQLDPTLFPRAEPEPET